MCWHLTLVGWSPRGVSDGLSPCLSDSLKCHFYSSEQVVDSDRPEGSKFRLTGKGVDQDPKGTFRINENTGSVSVTRTLDRETIATYQVSSGCLLTPCIEIWISERFLPTEPIISVPHQTQESVARGASGRAEVEHNSEGPLAHQQSHRACATLWVVESNERDTREEEVKTLRPSLAFRGLWL